MSREVDCGTLLLTLPAAVTIDRRLDEPSYAKLPNIMKANKKALRSAMPADLKVKVAPRLRTVRVAESAARVAGCGIPDVNTLIENSSDKQVCVDCVDEGGDTRDDPGNCGT